MGNRSNRNLGWYKILKTAFFDFFEDRAMRLGAAVAYYAVFSMGPLLLIAIVIAGQVFGRSDAQSHVVDYIRANAGPQAARVVQGLLAGAARPRSGLIATVVGIIAIFFGSLGVFTQLKYAMNTIWDIAPKPSPGIWYYVKTYLFSFASVIAMGILLVALLFASTFVSVAGNFFEEILPGGAIVWHVITIISSIIIITLLFACTFKLLPDVYVRWRDLWAGAIITAVLFAFGNFGLGIYIAHGSFSTYGVAGAFLAMMLWVYWSAQIFFFGAEITQVYANSRGGEIRPKPYAMLVKKQVPLKDT